MKINLTMSLLFGAVLMMLTACNWNKTEKAQQQIYAPDRMRLLLSAELYSVTRTITKNPMEIC